MDCNDNFKPDPETIIEEIIAAHKAAIVKALDKEDDPIEPCQEPLIDRLTDEVISPARYNQYRIETIEMMRRIWGNDAVRLWAEMTAFKYRMRLGHKDETDLELAKENWYLNYSKTIFQDETSKKMQEMQGA